MTDKTTTKSAVVMAILRFSLNNRNDNIVYVFDFGNTCVPFIKKISFQCYGYHNGVMIKICFDPF